MKKNIKYLFSLLAVLMIGFILGFLINGRIIRAKVNRMQNYFTEQGFNRALIRIIRPSPEQMDNLKPIFRKYARQNRQRLLDLHEVQKNSFNRFEKEIKPYLRRDQFRRLELFKKHHERRFFKKPPFRRGRPPRGL